MPGGGLAARTRAANRNRAAAAPAAGVDGSWVNGASFTVCPGEKKRRCRDGGRGSTVRIERGNAGGRRRTGFYLVAGLSTRGTGKGGKCGTAEINGTVHIASMPVQAGDLVGPTTPAWSSYPMPRRWRCWKPPSARRDARQKADIARGVDLATLAATRQVAPISTRSVCHEPRHPMRSPERRHPRRSAPVVTAASACGGSTCAARAAIP